MNFNEYQQAAARTAAHEPARDTLEKRLANFGLGITGEAGEVADTIKKVLFHGRELDPAVTKLKEELGDVLWYITMLADTLGLTLEEVADGNIGKLRKRYSQGFSEADSAARADEHA